LHGPVAGLSNLLGRTRFTVPVSSVVLGRRFAVTVVARTPLATTRVTRSVVLGGTA